MRLGDLDALKEFLKDIKAEGGHKYYRKGVQDCLDSFIPQIIDDQPTIDPETLPIVQELRAQLAKVTVKRNAAIGDLNDVLATTDALREFVREEIRPFMRNDSYLSLIEGINAIDHFEHQDDWKK